jgi:bacteriocin-like protein
MEAEEEVVQRHLLNQTLSANLPNGNRIIKTQIIMTTKGKAPMDANTIELSENELNNVAGGFGGYRNTQPARPPYTKDVSNITNPGRRPATNGEDE